MDERQIERALRGVDVPPPDENARKRALNLALAEFDAAQAERKKRAARQGFGFLGRLTGRFKRDPGDRLMNKRYLYGSVATVALALVIGVPVTLQTWVEAQRDQMLAKTPTESGGKAEGRGAPGGILAMKSPPLAKNEREMAFANKPGETYRGGARSDDATATGRRAEERLRSQIEPSRSATVDRLTGTAGPAKPDAKAPATRPAPSPAVSAEKKAAAQRPVGQLAQPQALMRNLSQGDRDAFSHMSRSQAKQRIAPPGDVQPRHYQDVGRDRFQDIEQNPVKRVATDPVSTFSIDVDTASYAFVRRQLTRGVLPQKDAVRIEELINYFDYAYALPETRERPFQPTVSVTPSPWKAGNKLIHIGIKGYDIEAAEKPRSNLVFLLDVSGSMNAPDKLPLMVNSMKLLLDGLGKDDTVAIVVYAGAAGTVLEPTKVAEKHKILAALDRLRAGGSTAGAAGIRQAYALAEGTFDKNAVNRVILATDGDFNVGITNREELKDFVERKRKTGVFLSVLGFGQGNLNDHLMQTLAQNGNGVAAHIDTLSEARKVLVDEATSTLFPIAKDVKIQVEFNPKTVAEYRLIGYETRALKREDFNNDKVDAGDIGAGHTVTAIYEITPVGSGNELIGASRYAQAEPKAGETQLGNEYAFLKIRYKLPKDDTSTLITRPVTTADDTEQGNVETRWASAVAAFGQLLKGGKYTGSYSYDDVIALARGARGDDPFGYRAEFLNLVRLAKSASALPKN